MSVHSYSHRSTLFRSHRFSSISFIPFFHSLFWLFFFFCLYLFIANDLSKFNIVGAGNLLAINDVYISIRVKTGIRWGSITRLKYQLHKSQFIVSVWLFGCRETAENCVQFLFFNRKINRLIFLLGCFFAIVSSSQTIHFCIIYLYLCRIYKLGERWR